MPSKNLPTSANIASNENRIYSGVRLNAEGRPLHLWESGLNEDLQWAVVLAKYGMLDADFLYTYTTLVNGDFKSYGGQRFSWPEMGRLRKGFTVSSFTAVGGATIDVTTTNTEIVARANQRLNLAAGNQQAHVESVTTSGGFEVITLSKVDGTNWAAPDIAANDVLGVSNFAFAEATGQPAGLNWTPERKSQKMTLTKETYEESGDAATQQADVLYAEGGVAIWAYAEQMFTMMNHKKDVGNIMAWSQESADDATIYSSRGIFRDMLANSPLQPYATSLDETDMQDGLKLMNETHANEEWLGLAGVNAMFDVQNNLKTYVVDGNSFYGNFGAKKPLAVGLHINQYSIMGKILNFKHYKGLDDENQTGSTAAAASATNISYKDSIFFINAGNAPAIKGSAGKYLSFAYKAFGGINRSMVVAYRAGMTGRVSMVNGAGLSKVVDQSQDAELLQSAGIPVVSTDVDKDSFYMLSQVAPCLKDVSNAHLVFRKTS